MPEDTIKWAAWASHAVPVTPSERTAWAKEILADIKKCDPPATAASGPWFQQSGDSIVMVDIDENGHCCVYDMLVRRQYDESFDMTKTWGEEPDLACIPGRELGYLIEKTGAGAVGDAWWWCGTDKWTQNSLDAIRFGRRVDAERFLKTQTFSSHAFVTEHIWGL